MPALVANYQVKQTVTQVKQSYSMLNQAFSLAIEQEGTVDGWTAYANKIKPYLKLIRGSEAVLHDNTANVVKSTLANGTNIFLRVQNNQCTNNRGPSEMLSSCCGYIDIDVNGDKEPNLFGVDQFEFLITKYGIVPYGLPDMYLTINVPDSGSYFKRHCQGYGTTTWTGWGCAAWVIYNENMDYLHCDDLSWDVKTKCD
jgi:hypothetical protein